jgi:hypothetical protein
VPRVLSSARARVTTDRQEEYLRTVGKLAERHADRGRHLWLFRRRGVDDEFIEFSEGPDDGRHREAGPADGTEAMLEEKLAALARYDERRNELFDEVKLTDNAGA